MTVKMKKSPMQSGRRDVVYIEDDFFGYTDAGDKGWDGGADQGGDVPAAVADMVGGVIDMDAGATADNDESWLETTQEIFAFGDKKPLGFEWLGYYEETTGDTSSVFVGFMNALSTTPLQNDGAGPKADFCGFGIYRVGSTAGIAAGNLTALDAAVWWAVVDNPTNFAQWRQRLDATNAPQNLSGVKQDAEQDTVYRLRAECTPLGLKSATVLNLDFAFWINDVLVATHNCDMTIANFSNMNYGMALHAGENAATGLFCDYTNAWQQRINLPD